MKHRDPHARPRTAARWSLLLLLPVLWTCGGLTVFSVDVDARTEIPQRSIVDELLGPLAFLGFEGFDITQSQEFRNQGYGKDDVDSVRMTRLSLVIAAPGDADFDFLQRIAFSVSAPGLPTVEIARLDPVPRGVATLELEVDEAFELQPYVVAPSMTLTAQATGQRPPQRTTVDAAARFRIDVNLSAACN
jgi:hypothetical protein